MTGPLDAGLAVAPIAEGLSLTLTVTNAGEERIDLSFHDGQRAEFVVEEDGEERWRWGGGRTFAQALATETLASGESADFDAEWPDPPAGEYRIRAWLVADDAEAEASMTVVVPDGDGE